MDAQKVNLRYFASLFFLWQPKKDFWLLALIKNNRLAKYSLLQNGPVSTAKPLALCNGARPYQKWRHLFRCFRLLRPLLAFTMQLRQRRSGANRADNAGGQQRAAARFALLLQ